MCGNAGEAIAKSSVPGQHASQGSIARGRRRRLVSGALGTQATIGDLPATLALNEPLLHPGCFALGRLPNVRTSVSTHAEVTRLLWLASSPQ